MIFTCTNKIPIGAELIKAGADLTRCRSDLNSSQMTTDMFHLS